MVASTGQLVGSTSRLVVLTNRLVVCACEPYITDVCTFAVRPTILPIDSISFSLYINVVSHYTIALSVISVKPLTE